MDILWHNVLDLLGCRCLCADPVASWVFLLDSWLRFFPLAKTAIKIPVSCEGTGKQTIIPLSHLSVFCLKVHHCFGGAFTNECFVDPVLLIESWMIFQSRISLDFKFLHKTCRILKRFIISLSQVASSLLAGCSRVELGPDFKTWPFVFNLNLGTNLKGWDAQADKGSTTHLHTWGQTQLCFKCD